MSQEKSVRLVNMKNQRLYRNGSFDLHVWAIQSSAVLTFTQVQKSLQHKGWENRTDESKCEAQREVRAAADLNIKCTSLSFSWVKTCRPYTRETAVSVVEWAVLSGWTTTVSQAWGRTWALKQSQSFVWLEISMEICHTVNSNSRDQNKVI